MKICTKAIMFSMCFGIFTSCGRITADEDQANERSDRYLNASGTHYAGEISQEIAMGCDFVDVSVHPSIVLDQYLSEDNEEFCYDKQGRLYRYKNNDRVFLGKTPNESGEGMSDEQIESYCYDIATYYLDPDYGFETVFNPETGELHIDGINEQYADFRESATVKVNRSGDICYIKVNYNTLEQPVDDETRRYFDEQANEYLEKECERLHDDCYEINSVSYELIDSNLYAIYSCTFYGTEGMEFCESIGFSKSIS